MRRDPPDGDGVALGDQLSREPEDLHCYLLFWPGGVAGRSSHCRLGVSEEGEVLPLFSPLGQEAEAQSNSREPRVVGLVTRAHIESDTPPPGPGRFIRYIQA